MVKTIAVRITTIMVIVFKKMMTVSVVVVVPRSSS